MATLPRGCRDRNATNGQLREIENSQQNSGDAHAEGPLDMRPMEQSAGMSLEPAEDQSPLMGPSTFNL